MQGQYQSFVDQKAACLRSIPPAPTGNPQRSVPNIDTRPNPTPHHPPARAQRANQAGNSTPFSVLPLMKNASQTEPGVVLGDHRPAFVEACPPSLITAVISLDDMMVDLVWLRRAVLESRAGRNWTWRHLLLHSVGTGLERARTAGLCGRGRERGNTGGESRATWQKWGFCGTGLCSRRHG